MLFCINVNRLSFLSAERRLIDFTFINNKRWRWENIFSSADDATALTGRKRAVFYVIKKHTLSHLVTCAGGKMLVKNVAF